MYGWRTRMLTRARRSVPPWVCSCCMAPGRRTAYAAAPRQPGRGAWDEQSYLIDRRRRHSPGTRCFLDSQTRSSFLRGSDGVGGLQLLGLPYRRGLDGCRGSASRCPGGRAKCRYRAGNPKRCVVVRHALLFDRDLCDFGRCVPTMAAGKIDSSFRTLARVSRNGKSAGGDHADGKVCAG